MVKSFDAYFMMSNYNYITYSSIGVTTLINETLLRVASTGGVKDVDYFTSPDFTQLSAIIDTLVTSVCAVTASPTPPPTTTLAPRTTRPIRTGKAIIVIIITKD